MLTDILLYVKASLLVGAWEFLLLGPLVSELQDIIIIGGAIASTIAVWRSVVKPIHDKLESLSKLDETVSEVNTRLKNLEHLVHYDYESHRKTIKRHTPKGNSLE